MPIVDELNPKPANQVWGCCCELAVDTSRKATSNGQMCTLERRSVEVTSLYFHVVDVRSIFDDGWSGCFNIHRDYFYQLETQGKEAFSTRKLASMTDPTNHAHSLERRMQLLIRILPKATSSEQGCDTRWKASCIFFLNFGLASCAG